LKHITVRSACALAAIVALAALPTAALAQGAAPAAGKKELVAKLLALQQPGIEQLAVQLAEQPARQAMQQAGAIVQRLPQDKREAVARDVDADLKKYVDEAVPLVRARATELAPLTVGALLEERFTEDELRQIVATLENPAWRKFQGAAGDMNRALIERLVTDVKGTVDPKVQAMQQAISARLQAAAPAPAPAAAPARSSAPAAPAKKP
jgi:uncharacterized protein